MDEELPLSSFSLQHGAYISENGSLIVPSWQGSGIVVYGPYVPFKMGLYTFDADVFFPEKLMPKASIDIYGNGVIFASQRISTHCRIIRFQAYVSVDCRLEVRFHSESTAFEIRRLTFCVGAEFGASARDKIRQQFVHLVNPDGHHEDFPQEWAKPSGVFSSLFDNNCVQILPANSLYIHEGLLRQAGVIPAVIQQFFGQNNRIHGDDSGSTELLNGYPKVSNAFQQGIVMSGFLEMLSPYDGTTIRTQNSIPVPINHLLSIVYEFSGENPIVVGVGTGWAGMASFLWLVKQDIIVLYDSIGFFDWANPESVISEYMAFCVQHIQEIRSYRKCIHTVALASGFNNNLGHYFWNETSGLERIIRLHILHNVEMIYCPSMKWLSMREIFDRDHLPTVIELDDWEMIRSETLDRRQILVRPTGTRLDDSLASKLKRAAVARFKSEAPERLQRARALTSNKQLVLYVNLRAHNKAWVEQDEGIIKIVQYLRSQDKRNIVVYLDGFKDCEASAKTIGASVIKNVIFVSGIVGTGVGFSETLYWAFRSEFFIAVIGSGLVPVTWIANKPGICHGDVEHLAQMTWWRDVRSDLAPIGWPRADQIKNLKNQAYSNYSISPADMLKLFSDVWSLARAGR